MVPRTRRCVLHGAAALLGGLAGCGRSMHGETTATRSVPPDREDAESVPDHLVLRNTVERPPVWFAPETTAASADGSSAGAASGGERERRDDRGFVADAETAARLRFADVDGAEEAEQFVNETDYRTETVYVESRPVRECFTLELCNVEWASDDIHTQYGSYYRAADVSCRADAKDTVSTLIRIPEALDPSNVRSHGSGWSSNGCQSRRPERSETTADAPHFGPKSAGNSTGTANETKAPSGTVNGTAPANGTATTTEPTEDGR
ncbi:MULTISPECIES: hypothetical protein [Halorussus]|uniref:hypothetical protein n=1 Tax=Halorussus TaxID=1070314 RepID=UPI00209C903F|nr:hypothetical protein [Halorussus vallis]USZ77785.1 hypothetical protein NGM07_21625 [Halorussus vallis]